MRMAVIYARVSSEQQREENTIASQTASLIEFAKSHDLEVPKEWVFEDEGYSGATLERPGLERVRRIYAMYTVEGLSMREITRRLNSNGVPTRKAARWERSVVWAVLRNPAYRGLACFGKTRICARMRVMRPQRRRGVTMPSTTASHERPREEWIGIPVPALVTEESF